MSVQENQANRPKLQRKFVEVCSVYMQFPSIGIRLMTFNIMCQRQILKRFRPKPDDPLFWKNRTRNNIRDFLNYNADVLCLQEVDHFKDTYGPFLAKRHYAVAYLEKAVFGHGLCIAWNTAKLARLHYEKINFDESPLTHPTLTDPQTHTIAQIIVLKTKEGNGGMILANVHLYHKEGHHFTKLRQVFVTIVHLMRLKQRYPEFECILAGDFNFTPSTPVYELLTRSINENCNYFKRIESEREEQKLNSEELVGRFLQLQPPKLNDIYPQCAWTQYSKIPIRIDYVFTIGEHIGVKRILDVPKAIVFKGGLPNHLCGSDHIPLVFDLQIKN